MRLGPDPSSFAQPDLVKVTHIDLDWSVNFQQKTLAGTAAIKFLIVAKAIEEIVSKNHKYWAIDTIYPRNCSSSMLVNSKSTRSM